MAHQSTTIPDRNPRNEPISWPKPEETLPRALPPRTPPSANEVYRSSLAAAGNSFRAARRKASDTFSSLTGSVRRFADDRPLHFVGLVAGIFLLGGVGLRIWRSRQDA